MNPLDLSGPEFLGLYAKLAVAAIVAGFLLRRIVEGFGVAGAGVPSSLAAHEFAYLRGGFDAVAEATLATLIRRGAIAADDTSNRLVLASPAGAIASKNRLESDFLASLDREASLPARVMRDRVAALADRLFEPLEQRGFAFSAEQRRSLRLAFCLPMVAVLALGVAKVAVGLARSRPVSILVLFCILTAIGAVAMFARRPIATAAGRTALRRARAENEALRETAARRTANLSPDDVAMAVGLFGLEAVADPSMHALRRQLHAQEKRANGTSSCGSGSSCGSSSGSSCGSGCGGGGGCGGCGG
jgi:uncharacterized protein (TIGR04222 family)